MEYLEGGFYWNAYYWGVAGRFTKEESNDIAAILTIGAGAAGIIAVTFPPAAFAAGIAAGIQTIGLGVFWLGGNHDGVYMEYNVAFGLKVIPCY